MPTCRDGRPVPAAMGYPFLSRWTTRSCRDGLLNRYSTPIFCRYCSMQFCDINKIPSQISEGKMTADEGAAMIERVVKSNPRSFGLAGLNDDIIEALFDRFDTFCCQNILKVFDSDGGTLQNQLTLYIHYLVRQQKCQWRSEHKLQQVCDDEEDTPQTATHGLRRILRQRAKGYTRIRQSHQR